MITDLRIHDDERVEHADAPEDCNTREFLVDVLRTLHPGSNPRDWTLRNGTPGKSLQLDHTLKQNQVHSHDDLYLVSIREPVKLEKLPDPIIKPQDLELEITLPDGNTIRSEARPSARPAEILAKIIKRFNLPLSDDKGRPNRWVLVHQKTDRVLDSDKTMVENVLDTGDRLAVKVYGEDLKLEVIGPNEKTRHSEAPPDTKAAALLAQLAAFYRLADVDKKGKPLNWILVDQKTDRPLDLDQTLAENGLVSGARLLLQPSNIDLDLQVTAPSGETRQTQAPPDTRTAAFLADLVASFHLPQSDNKGKPLTWLLVDQKTNRALDPNKTLAESGLITGDLLALRQPEIRRSEQPENGAPPRPRKWLRKPAVLISLALLGLLLAAAIILRVIPRPAVKVTLQPETARLSSSGTQKFNASVKNGRSQGVTWSTVPKIGIMSPGGMYTAPTVTKKERQVVVIATSDDDPTKSAEAIVTLLPTITETLPEPLPAPSETETASTPAANSPASVTPEPPVTPLVAPTQLHVQPALAILGALDTRRFAVIPKQDDPVAWSLRPALGTISTNGLYTAPSLIHQKQRVNVTASIGGTSVASAIVTLQPAVLSGITSSAGENGQMVYAATVSNTKDSTVLWSLNPQIGSISAQGVYTPPAGTTTALQAGTNPSQVVTLTARSQADPNQSTAIVIRLAQIVTVRLNPFNPRLTNNERVTISATVTGTNNRTVTWSAVGPGQIMPFGEYVAPPNIPPGGARVEVRATSNADPVKSATAWITLYPSPTFQGPRQGVLTWQGNIKANNTLTINDSQASSGKVSGGLPGVPIQIQVNTDGCQVLTYPSPANNWKTIVIQTHAHLHTISISWHVEHQ
jgi:hypothetical protein